MLNLHYFVPGARQILNLLNQNKQHARKQSTILQAMTKWRSYIFATYSRVTWCHINLFGYINTYTFVKYTREKSERSKICRQKLEITFTKLPSSYQKWRNSYFVKIKTFRLETNKLLENRRKTYILDVTCNKFYFGEVREKVLGQCSGQGIYFST